MHRMLAGAVLSFSIALAASSAVQDVGAAAAAQQDPRRPFCRVVEAENDSRLECLFATYQRGDATLTLFGCIHVADQAYYDDLQQRFAACDALLFEMIGPAGLRPYPGMELGADGHWISTLQVGMANGLQLADQFECLDYRPEQFVHADMTDDEWYEALERAGSSELGEMFSVGDVEIDREAEAKQRPIDLVGAFRRGGGIAELRLIVARLMCEPDGTHDEPTVVIHARNERCLEVLKQQVAAGRTRLGIFYGAAHMEHLEQRLLDDLGWRRTGEQWVEAWDCRPSSFPKVERGLKQKRWRAGRDLQKLYEAADLWRRENGRTPTLDELRASCDDGKLPGRADGVDPWGRAYVLRATDSGFEVRCLGSDGEADTEDDLVEPESGGAAVR